MVTRISEIKFDIETGKGELVYNKINTVECAARLYGWIMENDERVLIETLALNGGEIALNRLRGVIDAALEMAAKVKSGLFR